MDRTKLFLSVSAPGFRRWRASFSSLLILTFAAFTAGCISDATLLQENSAVALRTARVQARTDLECPQADVMILSEQVVPGAPWGYFYSDYRIRAEGCGRNAVYEVKCRDERLCKTTRNPQ